MTVKSEKRPDRVGLLTAFIGMAARMMGPSMSIAYAMERRAFAKARNDGRGGGYSSPHQGPQEMARRRRQIERGQLKAENGLVRGIA